MTGTLGFHLKTHGKVNSSEMLNVWNETSKEEINENQLPHGGPSERRKREIDSDSIWDRYDREDPSVGTKQITTGFRKWAERYLSECSGQKNFNYQVNRMNKWNGLLQAHLAAQEE